MKKTASLLSVAYDAFINGDDALAKKLTVAAFQSEDAPELFDAIDTVAEDDEGEDDTLLEEEEGEEDDTLEEGDDDELEGQDDEELEDDDDDELLEEEDVGEEEEACEEGASLANAPDHIKAKIRSIANRIASRDGGAHSDLAFKLLSKIA